MRSDTGQTVLPANNTISAFTPSRRAFAPTNRGMARLSCLGGWLGWDKFLSPGVEFRYGYHPSTNRARRRVTKCAEPRPKMAADWTRFALLGQSAAGRRLTTEDELEQLSGSDRSSTLALRKSFWTSVWLHLVISCIWLHVASMSSSSSV